MTPQEQKAELRKIRKEVIALTKRASEVCDSLDDMAKACTLNLTNAFKVVNDKLYTLEFLLQFHFNDPQ